MFKIVLAIDAFKGSLSSFEAEKAAEEAIKTFCPAIEVVKTKLSDGGEGLLDCLFREGDKKIELDIEGALKKVTTASYIISKNTAIIESATAIGLTLLKDDERNPFLTSSFPLGLLIADALKRGCGEFIVRLGGSSTCDAGIGMLQALGFKFYDKYGKTLGRGGRVLELINSIDTSDANPLLSKCRFKFACDVKNTFYGKNGAAYIFAPQKGADPTMTRALDKGLKNVAKIIKSDYGTDLNTVSGAGAAGGIAGLAHVFLKATLTPGIDLVLEHLNFKNTIKSASLILTGEGKMDKQSLMGKAPFGVLQYGLEANIPVLALCGRVDNKKKIIKAGFMDILEVSPRDLPLTELMQTKKAMQFIRTALTNYLNNSTLLTTLKLKA